MKPLFSIIIPCYNCEKYISFCLDSIISQNYKNFEVICLDDCSKDNTCSIINEYAKSDKRISLIKNKENKGPGYLRNLGLQKSRGKYVLFCDADDWYEQGLFRKLSEIIIKQPDVNIIEFRYYMAKNEQEKQVADWLNRGKSGIRKTHNENIMLATALWNKCYRRDFVVQNQLKCCITNRSGEEIPFHICAMLLNDNFYYLDFVGYNWFVNPDSLSRSDDKYEKFLSGVWVMLEDLKSELIRLNLYKQEDYVNYCATILNWHISEKFSYSGVYRRYYQNVRKFMVKNKCYLTKPEYIKIIKTPYWLKILKSLKRFNMNKKNNDKISVIMPVYNGSKYIDKAIMSILNQTYNNIELICIDDCSTDSSVDIIKKIQQKDNRLILICNKENQGQGAVRNIGLKNASGQYIAFIDDDDYYENNALETMYFLLKKHKVPAVFCNWYIDTGNEKIPQYNYKEGMHNVCKDSIAFFISPWAKLIEKDFLDSNKILFDSGFVAEDRVFQVKLLTHCKKIYLSKQCVYHWNRNNMQSVTQTSFNKGLPRDYAYIKIAQMCIDYIMTHRPELFNPEYEIMCFRNSCLHVPRDYAKRICDAISKVVSVWAVSKKDFKDITNWEYYNYFKRNDYKKVFMDENDQQLNSSGKPKHHSFWWHLKHMKF